MYYVYKLSDSKGCVLYVGRTNNVTRRLTAQHFTKRGHLPSSCYDRTATIHFTECSSAHEAKIIERYFVNKLAPEYNTQGILESIFGFELTGVTWTLFKGETSVKKADKSYIDYMNSLGVSDTILLEGTECAGPAGYSFFDLKIIKDKFRKNWSQSFPFSDLDYLSFITEYFHRSGDVEKGNTASTVEVYDDKCITTYSRPGLGSKEVRSIQEYALKQYGRKFGPCRTFICLKNCDFKSEVPVRLYSGPEREVIRLAYARHLVEKGREIYKDHLVFDTHLDTTPLFLNNNFYCTRWAPSVPLYLFEKEGSFEKALIAFGKIVSDKSYEFEVEGLKLADMAESWVQKKNNVKRYLMAIKRETQRLLRGQNTMTTEDGETYTLSTEYNAGHFYWV